MKEPNNDPSPAEAAEIIDFDPVLLNACEPGVRTEILQEARLLSEVFAQGDADILREMAQQLSAGLRDNEMNRAHARRLAAALKRLAEAA
ncbi:MAG: hypothetical protein U1C74_09655 [Phenylobacterium sp.]|nr:hypothetical protein [Phenylobacterium sp.]